MIQISFNGHIIKILLWGLLPIVSLYANNYKTKSYTIQDGLPTLEFYDVAQDAKGKIWFTCLKGICYYDGYDWKLQRENIFNNNVINAKIFIDQSNNTWAIPKHITQSIIYYRNEKWIEFPVIIKECHRDSSIVTAFDISINNGTTTVAIGTEYKGLFLFQNNGWLNISQKEGLPDININDVKIINNKIYAATSKGLTVIENNTIVKIIKSKPIFKLAYNPGLNNSQMRLLGKNWIGHLQDESIKYITYKTNLPFDYDQRTSRVIVDNKNNIYLSNYSSLFVINTSTNEINKITYSNDEAKEGITSFYVDREENIWVTSLRGVKKIQKTPFTNYYKEDGLLENEVTAIESFNDGTMVFGHNKGISILRNSKFVKTPLLNDEDINPNFITRVLDMCLSNNNNLMFTSGFMGVGKLSTDYKLTWFKYEKDDNLLYSGIAIDTSGIVWIGTNKGLFYLENSKLIRDERISKEIYVRKIIRLKNGSMALCTSQEGVIIINKSSVTFYKSENEKTNSVYSIHEDENDLIYAGTLNGLFFLNNGKLEKYQKESFAISRPVYFINKDLQNNLWFGTDNGIIKWDKATYRVYSSNDGLAGYETNRSAFKIDNSGRIWIGTDNGLSRYTPEFDNSNFIKPIADILYLEKASGEKIELNNSMLLNYNQNNFFIHYRGYSFIDENSLEYRINIRNTDSGWQDEFITTNNKSRFSNLPFGSYVFSVSVKNSQGIWGDPVKSSLIKISKPFYYQPWFYFVNILIVLIIIYSVHHFISQKKYSVKLENAIKDRTKELTDSERDIRNLTQELIKSQENERQRISYELHDNLAQDLSTSKIILDSFNENGSPWKNDFNKKVLQISSLLNKSINTVRDLSYYLRQPELDEFGFINAVSLYAKDFSKKNKININFINTGVEKLLLSYDKKINLYRIIQEALTNIKKHSEAENTVIKLVASSPYIILRIEDNGKGFDVNEQILKSTLNKQMGIKNIKERIKLLNGTFNIDSDLKKGTKIFIKVPYE